MIKLSTLYANYSDVRGLLIFYTMIKKYHANLLNGVRFVFAMIISTKASENQIIQI